MKKLICSRKRGARYSAPLLYIYLAGVFVIFLIFLLKIILA